MLSSIKTIFKVGPGPSSSHTIGPFNAANDFMYKINDFDVTNIKVVLYGSLALTGKGHKTDYIIKKALNNYKVEIIFNNKDHLSHPNTMDFIAFKNEQVVKKIRYISLGGGDIKIENEKIKKEKDVYPFSSFKEMSEFLISSN